MFFIKRSCQVRQAKQPVGRDLRCTDDCTSAFPHQDCQGKWVDSGHCWQGQCRCKIPSYSGTLWCGCHDDQSSGSFQHVHGWCWILKTFTAITIIMPSFPINKLQNYINLCQNYMPNQTVINKCVHLYIMLHMYMIASSSCLH